MTINERLKYLRTQLKMTTRAFGASINMSGGAITNMEKGTRNITDRTVRDICREYNVNSDWLIHGTGTMYEDIYRELNIDEDVKQLITLFNELNDSDKELVENMINSLAQKNQH